MPRRSGLTALALLLLAELFVGVATPADTAVARRNAGKPVEPIPGRYIVVLADPDGSPAAAARGTRRGRDRRAVAAAAEAVAGRRRGKVRQVYAAVFEGFAVETSARDARDLLRDPDVVGLVPDYPVELAAQTVPRGVHLVRATRSPTARIDGIDERVDADVAVLDTGIDGSHPDLNVAGGFNCTTSNSADWADNNGHGTHVAGTIAALDNTEGVVGAAPGARLWAVKVIPDGALAADSHVLCGLDWVADNANVIDVVNASIGQQRTPRNDFNGLIDGCGNYALPATFDPYHLGWCYVASLGIPIAVAAMNWGIDAKGVVPAAYNEVLTVSNIYTATLGKRRGGRPTYALWRTSDYGEDIDLAAPGVNIRSTLPGGGYGNQTGASMAAPLAAGAAALYVATHGRTSALQVMNALKGRSVVARLRGDPDGITEGRLNAESL